MSVTFLAHVQRALETLGREHRSYADAMWGALAGREVWLVVASETVRLAGRRVESGAPPDRSRGVSTGCIVVETTPPRILRLADGHEPLLDAILDDGVQLWGAVDDLLAGRDAFAAFIGGAVRSPSFPQLLREFRSWCREP